MNIEIAEPGRMTQSGSSLLRLIQNNKTPVLDLLVRESIQNSLDAHKEGVRSVTVEYRTGTFSSRKLSGELEGITDALMARFPHDQCEYLAVCDSNTVGLTGEMDVQKVQDNNYGNLLKLVYEICKPQEAEGAGGSWGLGKTVYFRIGIGLVIYYSRIDEGNGKYSVRLAASYVENETVPNAMIPKYREMARRGIAWWGEKIRENTTVPVTDETYVSEFLKIFGISPYTGDKTGTMIIIPYINGEALLANNRIDYADTMDEHLSPYWYSSLDNYLRIAVQRWYAPRLANPAYPYGAFLKVLVNGRGIAAEDIEPVFKAVQTLYNRANHVSGDDFLASNDAETFVSNVIVKKFLDETNAGAIACTKLTRKNLQMEVPHNKLEPAVYFNCEVADKSANKPVVFFVRQPGMIVSYEYVSAWTAGLPSTDKDEYIFGIFVLNSQNRFKVSERTVEKLEEYVRKSEMADHTSWNDWSDPNFNPRIISKIQRAVTQVIGARYASEDVEHQPRENSELGRYLGDLILPPSGFGSAPDPGNGGTGNQGRGSRNGGKGRFSFLVDYDAIIYRGNTMTVPMELKTPANRKLKNTAFEVQIDTDSGKIKMSEWQNDLKLDTPFHVQEVRIRIEAVDGEKIGESLSVNAQNAFSAYRDIGFELRKTAAGTAFGLEISAREEHSVKIRFDAVICLQRKDVRPAFVFEKEGK